jgi:uncharacterized protein (TIGR02145 family)
VTTTNSQNCPNASKTGTITVNSAITYTNCNPSNINLGSVGFTSVNTWTVNGITISAPVTATYCSKGTYSGGSGPYNADCRSNSNTDYGHLFSWCMVAEYEELLCPGEWRVPTALDFYHIANDPADPYQFNLSQTINMNGWLSSGNATVAGYVENCCGCGYYWAATETSPLNAQRCTVCSYGIRPWIDATEGKYYGFSLRCVR